MDLNEANKLWFTSDPISGVLFRYNDYVQIESGEFAGEFANVISLMSIEPVTYLVELHRQTGGDIVVAQSEIEMVEPANDDVSGKI